MPLADLPQTNRQHPVPQNIMDVEFKLIGDLTMRQFIYLLVFGVSAYLSYVLVIGIFKWPTVITLALLGIGLAFVPIEERGLDEWIVNFIKAINSSTQKIWRKEPQLPTAFLYDSLAVVRQEMITLAPTSSRRKLEEYLKSKSDQDVDDPLDIPEREYVMKVRRAYPNAPRTLGPSVGVTLKEPIPQPRHLEESSEDKDTLPEKTRESMIRDQNLPSVSYDSQSAQKPSLQISKISSPVTKKSDRGEESKDKDKDSASKKVTERLLDRKIVLDPRIVQRMEPKIKEKEVENVEEVREFVLPTRPGDEHESFDYIPITPDMHSGRKFVNLVPFQDELILPIRGERIIKTSEEVDLEEDLNEKTRKLVELLENIRQEEGIGKGVAKKPPVVANVVSMSGGGVGTEAKGVVDQLKEQNENLAQEIDRLRSQIQRGKSMSLETSTQEQLLKRLESQKSKIASSYTELRKQVQDLQKKLEEKNTASTGPKFSEKVRSQIPVLTDKPNVVTGVVKDTEDKFLSDVLMIVKNVRGEAVRAFKTNSMGQFIVSTPLQNGTYTVEVSPANKIELTFDIIPIEVKGEVIPPLEVIGK